MVSSPVHSSSQNSKSEEHSGTVTPVTVNPSIIPSINPVSDPVFEPLFDDLDLPILGERDSRGKLWFHYQSILLLITQNLKNIQVQSRL